VRVHAAVPGRGLPWALLGLVLIAVPATRVAAQAAPTGLGAPPPSLCPPRPEPPLLTMPRPSEAGGVDAIADRVTRDGERITLDGDAELRETGRWTRADHIELDRAAERAELDGDVALTTPRLGIEADRGVVDIDTGAFHFERTRYREHVVGAQGRAERIEQDAEQVTRLHQGTFSTCPEQQEDWHLAAHRIELDPDTRQGRARNVTLWFKNVPLFYTPFIQFPLGDERMSGFLAPSFGQSSSSGFELATPYYWNIAPNFDATLTPVYLSRRGAQIESEWRWLTRQGEWQLNNEFLPDDNEFGDDRLLTRLQHSGRLGDSWTTALDVAKASDPDYFDDLGSELDLTSQTDLRRRGDLRWRSGRSEFLVRLQNFQTLDTTIARRDRPFEQLPRLDFETGGRRGGVEFDFDWQAIRFEREASTTGDRVRIVPAISYPIERPGWFLRPRLALDYTAYRLDRRADDPGRESIDRSLPITSLDGGLIFERLTSGYRQTLEPRLFYVHIPRDDQDDIPLFDAGEFDFTFGQLFRERRFTGGDRIGDASRLTLALTTRLLDRDNGREVLRASIGGIRHFKDREVQLRPGQREDRSGSDLLGELAISPSRAWRGNVFWQWDPDRDETRRVTSRLAYRGADGSVFNLGWRARRDERGEFVQDQIDGSFAWPVNPRWQLLGRLNHSLETDENLELLAGVEYRSCCWSLRTVAREYVSEDGQDSEASINFELVLRGLGGLGDDAGGIFERAILGYRDRTE